MSKNHTTFALDEKTKEYQSKMYQQTNYPQLE